MSTFNFKKFEILQKNSSMKVGTDAMLLGAVIQTENKSKALDVGAGTGVISLMIAQRSDEMSIDLVEIDQETAAECRFNCNNSSWKDRLQVYNEHFLDYDRKQTYDLIFSNPPFYRTTLINRDDKQSIAKHVTDLSPDLFMKKASELLSDLGDLWIIVPFQDDVTWVMAAEKCDLLLSAKKQVFGKRNGKPVRSILRFQRSNESQIDHSKITVREKDGSYTHEYVALTKEYHDRSL